MRQAQQTLSIAIMVLLFGSIYDIHALPVSTQQRIATFFAGASEVQLVLSFLGVFLLLDAVLIAAALARFRRTLLIVN